MESTKLFGPSLAAFGGFVKIFFFFRLFVRFKKKSSKPALWEEIAQSFQTDTRAVVAQKKKLLSFILFTHKFSRA